MKRLVICLCCLILSVGVLASAEMKNPDTFTYLWTSDIKSLDPAYIGSTPGTYPIFNCYDRLLNYYEDEISVFIPGIASIVPSVDNGLIAQAADGTVFYTEVPDLIIAETLLAYELTQESWCSVLSTPRWYRAT